MLRPLTLGAALSAFAFVSDMPARADLLFPMTAPDGRIGLASRPASAGKIEIEAADDFIATTGSTITGATFTGLLPFGLALKNINFVGVEIYQVFPADSVNPPSGKVPTRVNSPSDNALASRDSTAGLTFLTTVLNPNFTVANSILNGIHALPNQTTGGEGSVTGQEVQFNIMFTTPFNLAADHYFFKPEVGVSGGDFYWLSTTGPSVFPGDLQAWIRNSDLNPDWLRAGTDIVGGATPPKFNETFSLVGTPVPEPSTVALIFVGLAAIALKRRRG